MQAARGVIHKHRRDKSPVECRPANFEYSFIRAVAACAGRIVDTCCGLVAKTMPRSPRRLLIAALAPSTVLATVMLLLLPATAQQLGDEPRAEPVRREILAVYDSREEPRPD